MRAPLLPPRAGRPGRNQRVPVCGSLAGYRVGADSRYHQGTLAERCIVDLRASAVGGARGHGNRHEPALSVDTLNKGVWQRRAVAMKEV